MKAAFQSLAGLSLGDALGERFLFAEPQELARRVLPDGPWRYTDDTEMALSIVEMLQARKAIDQDRLATAFAIRYNPRRGYGSGAYQLLEAIGRNPTGYWRSLAPAMFAGRGSYGNGAAMRVAPLGAFFCDDFERAAEQARLSAQVTHTHPEGIAGAIATSVAAAWMARQLPWNREAFWDIVLQFTPAGLTRQGIERARQLPLDLSGHEAGQILGNGHQISAQDTVPFALWSASIEPDDFQATFWRTLSAQGDQDTNCAIACGVIGGRTPAPRQWLDLREKLPSGFEPAN